MKYVAVLRGINVGGNSMVKMADLKKCLEDVGYENVVTYINSGNVIFKSEISDAKKLTSEIERLLIRKFGFELKVVLRTEKEIENVVKNVPNGWDIKSDLRMYIAFVKEPVTPDEVISQAEPKEGVDFVEKGPGVVYMATLLSGITKSGINKLIGKKIYKEITIRNYNTTKKILSLMEVSK